MSDPINDMTPFIQAKSDQINADDLISGPITVQITGTSRGSAEQPVNIHIAGHRDYRPCKTCLRILVSVWGRDATSWVGRSITIYRDPTVRFGGPAVGGIRISAMSHIEAPFSISLAESKGKKTLHKIAVLKSTFAEALAELGIDADELDAYCLAAGKQRPDAGNDAYRGGILNALRGTGRFTFDAWKKTKEQT